MINQIREWILRNIFSLELYQHVVESRYVAIEDGNFKTYEVSENRTAKTAKVELQVKTVNDYGIESTEYFDVSVDQFITYTDLSKYVFLANERKIYSYNTANVKPSVLPRKYKGK